MASVQWMAPVFPLSFGTRHGCALLTFHDWDLALSHVASRRKAIWRHVTHSNSQIVTVCWWFGPVSLRFSNSSVYSYCMLLLILIKKVPQLPVKYCQLMFWPKIPPFLRFLVNVLTEKLSSWQNLSLQIRGWEPPAYHIWPTGQFIHRKKELFIFSN